MKSQGSRLEGFGDAKGSASCGGQNSNMAPRLLPRGLEGCHGLCSKAKVVGEGPPCHTMSQRLCHGGRKETDLVALKQEATGCDRARWQGPEQHLESQSDPLPVSKTTGTPVPAAEGSAPCHHRSACRRSWGQPWPPEGQPWPPDTAMSAWRDPEQGTHHLQKLPGNKW